MQTMEERIESAATRITPGIYIKDPFAAYWVSQVNLRLRREIAWCWYQRTQQKTPVPGMLPPLADATAENLDLIRHENQRLLFFQQDTAAAYLTGEIEKLEIHISESNQLAGSYWQDIVKQLQLDEASQFLLALAVAYRLDAAIGQLCATCMNDLSRPYPTLSLAQHLWDDPLEIMKCANPSHSLYQYGLLEKISNNFWLGLLNCHSILVEQLIQPDANLVTLLDELDKSELLHNKTDEISVARIKAHSKKKTQIIPLKGPGGGDFKSKAVAISNQLSHRLVIIDSNVLKDILNLTALVQICWMNGHDVYLSTNIEWQDELLNSFKSFISESPICINWYFPCTEKKILKQLPTHLLVPEIKVPSLNFQQRVQRFIKHLNLYDKLSEYSIESCAQRFRFEEKMIKNVAHGLINSGQKLTDENLILACAHEATIEFNELAQYVIPRFDIDELILPKKQKNQFMDVLNAMKNLTLVHHRWGTAKVWNESGISVLLCGPPGTGKTMAAEALSKNLDLPMFRIDLSQVVNKYIGETEKNLRRIFNAAEMMDCILFFDEADAIFGKRTDVKDAHDRFANIEISYLLERMERFKGMAVLATNRRRDLDEAFMRRLRYVVEFPIPEKKEREKIWSQIFPYAVDISELDMTYLARQFKISGGHIRSIAFNACLKSANIDQPDEPRIITMKNTLLAVKQEMEKMERSTSNELFGKYADLVKGDEE